MVKDFALDDVCQKVNAGGNCWKELLECIRDNCFSEKILYQQVLDLYDASCTMNLRC